LALISFRAAVWQTAPAGARPGKSLCDDVGIFELNKAQHLLMAGIRNGFVRSHVDAALAENFSDIVYTGRFSGTQIKIALLFEHKSSPDNDLPFQLYRYIGNLWENSLKQKQPRLPVIPIVLYHGWQSWTPGSLITRFENLPNAMKPYIRKGTRNDRPDC
jgi:hypothetical protein